MSTNDDSASRRARRSDQGDRRPRQERDERWDQSSSRDRAAADPYQDQRGRDSQSQRGAYSNFSRHSYTPPQDPVPPPKPAAYYPEPPRSEPPRYPEPPALGYAPPPAAYEPEPPHLGYPDAGRDDLFARDPVPPVYENAPYPPQGPGFQGEPYDQSRGHQPLTQPAAVRRDDPQYMQREAAQSPIDDYERSFSARMAQETQASRFFLPEDEPQMQRPAQPERGYAPPPPPPQYAANMYPPQDEYGARYGQDAWADDGLHDEDRGGGHSQHAGSGGSELDEDFFADEDELEQEHLPAPRRGRKKLLLVALAGAVVVGGGGAYLYKSLRGGGDSATPFIRADSRPLKEPPGNPGGKQYPNGEKTIYDRLLPDGQQVQVASFSPPVPQPQPQTTTTPVGGNSLEDRIDEALRKAQRTGEAPPPPTPGTRTGDQPTVVRSESYRPDGTRVDATRPPAPIIDMGDGQLPPPPAFGSPMPPPSQGPAPTPFRTAPVPMTPPQVTPVTPAARTTRSAAITPVEAAPPPAQAGGFYVSLKSAPDEKAIQRDLPTLTDKYKSVLGAVQVSSKIADLGSKGVTYRAVAGPLSTRQEAMELCQKIKGVGGDKACFVTN